jgi:IS1 family transposase
VSFPATLLPALKGDALELDELVIRFRFKRCYRYLWLVVSRLTHQVVAWGVGDRSEKTLQRTWFEVPASYRRKLVYTDFYEAYASFFRPWQHRPSAKGSGKTSVIEGLNNKWRNRVAGLVRKTVCVQSLDDLNKRLWIVLGAHNQFCLRQLGKIISTTH